MIHVPTVIPLETVHSDTQVAHIKKPWPTYNKNPPQTHKQKEKGSSFSVLLTLKSHMTSEAEFAGVVRGVERVVEGITTMFIR